MDRPGCVDPALMQSSVYDISIAAPDDQAKLSTGDVPLEIPPVSRGEFERVSRPPPLCFGRHCSDHHVCVPQLAVLLQTISNHQGSWLDTVIRAGEALHEYLQPCLVR